MLPAIEFDVVLAGGWPAIRWEIAIGKRPSRAKLAELIEAHGVPQEMGKYVADRFIRKKTIPADSKSTPIGRIGRAARALSLHLAVVLRHATLIAEGRVPRARAREMAIADVARQLKPKPLAPDTVVDIIRRGRKLAKAEFPGMWLQLSDALPLARARAAAAAQLPDQSRRTRG